jgi:DNA-directed RNA polymerase beta' subunit
MEMNMHMPQNVLSETELRHLAAIPYQIISPSSNSPLIGIYQDSMLGTYRFTRPDVEFSPREAMNILMGYSRVDVSKLVGKNKITNFDILSQITPPLTLKTKTKQYDDKVDDYTTSNNVLEIFNGKYVRGQMIASTVKGVLSRVCNDFGNMACSDYIDDLQQVITEYMKTSAYSVGVSDLISDRKTTEEILQVIAAKKTEVQQLTDKMHLGIFENKTGNNNAIEYENQVKGILNKATDQTGAIAKKSLSATNRFLIMVASGSKGNMVNISQMISCLGQQSVDGKRVPYGFDSRTLPHFSKYDDSPGARGFVENSYISGLTAPELFFHAMGGRMGLIDTAVKSVTWETPIVLIDENGKPVYTEIGRWIDAKLDNSDNKSRVQHFDEKNMELLNVNSIYVPTTCENGLVSWEEITAVTRHDPGTQLYEIKTLGGRSVTVTESKSLLVWNKEKQGFYEMLTPEIVIGDCVPVTMNLPEPPILIEKSEDDAIELATNFHKGNNDLSIEIVLYSTNFIQAFIQIIETLGMVGVSYDARNERNANILAMLYNRIGTEVSFNNNIVEIHGSRDNNHNNVVLDPIVEINIIGVENNPKMYDLTIPTTLNFGLANGLQVRDTSQTGYIQRRLVKGLEDLKVEYDMTVRNNMGKIVQFSYGEDSADPTRIENQSIPIVNMSVEDIYMHYDIVGMTEGEHDLIKIYTKGAATRVRRQRDEARTFCKKYIDYMLETRDQLVENVFKFKNEDSVKTPVSFHNLILNVQGQLGLNANSTVDITPLEAFQMIDAKYETLKLSSFCKPNKLFEVLYYYYLSPKDLLVNKRFNAKAIELLLESVHLNYKKSIVSPGEMVGVIAGQSIGEPTTQMSLTRNECVKIMKVEKGSAQAQTQVQMTSTKIGDFCDQIISENPELTFNTGHENSVETVLGTSDAEYYIMSVGEDETTKWSKISHVSRHPVNGELMRVKTKSGRMVETTTSHSHLVRQDNKVQPIVGRDMKVGMRIPVSKNISNCLKGPSDSRVQSHSDLTLINETVKIGNKTFVLDELFGWFIGAYLAEGSINYNTICITNISTAFIQNTIEFAARFGKECKIYEKESEYGHTTDVKFTCAELADLLKISCGNGSFNKSVPDFAFVAPDAFKARLIQAYIDGDGNIQCDEKHHMIRACSRSLQLIKDIALLINYFGMFGSIHSTQTRGSELHHLSISAKYAESYKTNIGSSLESKMVALNGLVEYLNRDDAHNVSDEIDKINGLGHIIANCGKTLELEGQSRIYGRWARGIKDASTVSIGRRTLQKYIAEFESSAKAPSIAEELRILKQAADADVVWDEIVEIDVWTPEQSEMVYDFTVPGNQTFLTDYGVYVHNTLNTFHLAGVASKSNVTRGVPRIEEILRLTRNPDKPSVTVYLRPQDQHDKDKATNYCNMLQHTKLIDVVKSVEICFDPNDHATKIHSDQTLIDQFYLFDKMATECNDNYSPQQPRSKWIIRIEIDAETLLEKNITMDDIHFAVTTVHGSEVSCVYSDMNSSNLVFRIRLNSTVFNRGKKKMTNTYAESLDQTDEIYLLKNFQDTILNNIVLRGVNRIVNVNPRIVKDMVVKEDGKYARKEAWVLDTTGSNLMDIFAMDFIDYTRTYSNDIREMYNILGIEAARQNILNEIVDVMEASDAYVNYHHLSILCDRMTVSKDLVPIYRSGILNDDIGPISKSTYEMHTEMFLQASRHGEFDQMRGVSANVMCGQQGYYGTNAFSLLLDMEAVMNMEDRDVDRKDVNDRIEELFGTIGKTDECSINRIRMDNNVHNLKNVNMGVCEDDGYEVF